MKHLFFTVAFIFSIAANATAVVTLTDSGAATGIENLDIGGTLYNVDFEAGNDAFSTHGGEELFWLDISSAIEATRAINHELGLLNIDSVNNGIPSMFAVWHPEDYLIIGKYSAGIWGAANSQSMGAYSTTGTVIGTAWSIAEVAAPAAVPVPAAAWLFGHALIGLAGIKRMKAGKV